MPTIGFNVETVQYKNLRFQVWDLGGQTSIRPYWRCYYQNTNAIIYVVDSCDVDRMGISRQELVAMLEEEELKEEDPVFAPTGPGGSAIKIEMERFFIETFNVLQVREAKWEDQVKMAKMDLWVLLNL